MMGECGPRPPRELISLSDESDDEGVSEEVIQIDDSVSDEEDVVEEAVGALDETGGSAGGSRAESDAERTAGSDQRDAYPPGALPPGWTRVVDFGQKKGYRGPGGSRAPSVKQAWAQHEDALLAQVRPTPTPHEESRPRCPRPAPPAKPVSRQPSRAKGASGSATADAADAEAGDDAPADARLWLQCDKCSKWRVMPLAYSPDGTAPGDQAALLATLFAAADELRQRGCDGAANVAGWTVSFRARMKDWDGGKRGDFFWSHPERGRFASRAALQRLLGESARWFCSMNPDPAFRSCGAREQTEEEVLEAEPDGPASTEAGGSSPDGQEGAPLSEQPEVFTVDHLVADRWVGKSTAGTRKRQFLVRWLGYSKAVTYRYTPSHTVTHRHRCAGSATRGRTTLGRTRRTSSTLG